MGLKKSVVLYMDGDLIGRDRYQGASCEKCIFFLTSSSECELLTPPKVAPKGVCALYIGGEPDGDEPRLIVPAETAGYIPNGPTSCGNCSKFISPSSCEVVEGDIEAAGCCNGWSKARGTVKVHNSMSKNQARQYLASNDSDSDY